MGNPYTGQHILLLLQSVFDQVNVKYSACEYFAGVRMGMSLTTYMTNHPWISQMASLVFCPWTRALHPTRHVLSGEDQHDFPPICSHKKGLTKHLEPAERAKGKLNLRSTPVMA